jgi:hypothetical protein
MPIENLTNTIFVVKCNLGETAGGKKPEQGSSVKLSRAKKVKRARLFYFCKKPLTCLGKSSTGLGRHLREEMGFEQSKMTIIYGGVEMATEAQMAANALNAKKGGVKTDEGKARVRLNAITHGLLTKEVLKKGEDVTALNQLRDNLMAETEPQGEIETILVDRIVSCIWRLRRAVRVESDILSDNWNNLLPYTHQTVAGWQSLGRYETMIERQFYKAVHELERLQRMRRGENTAVPLSIDVDVSRQN